MARRPSIIRPVRIETSFPEDLRARLDLHLFSTVEGRVPLGAYARFITEAVAQKLDKSIVAAPLVEDQSPKWIRLVASMLNQLGGKFELKRQTIATLDLTSAVELTENVETDSIIISLVPNANSIS